MIFALSLSWIFFDIVLLSVVRFITYCNLYNKWHWLIVLIWYQPWGMRMAAKFGDAWAKRETCRIHLSHIHADQVDCCGSPCASSPFDEVRSFNSLKGHRWVLHGTSRWPLIPVDSFSKLHQSWDVLTGFAVLSVTAPLPVQKNEPLEKMRAQFPQYSFSFRAASWRRKVLLGQIGCFNFEEQTEYSRLEWSQVWCLIGRVYLLKPGRSWPLWAVRCSEY